MKRLYIIALFVFASGFASAQENGNRDAQNRIVRGPYETNRFFDNIFVGVAGGVNLYFGENDSEGKFGKRLAPAMDIHVGKWFTPSIGARVGYAGLQVVLDEGYITNVAVRPDCRRRGVAGKLLDVFERFAEGNHLAFLSLEVRASNYAAIALYGQHGYRGVGRRRNYYEHPKEDAVIMTREFGEAAK